MLTNRGPAAGGHGERTNKQVVEAICQALDQLLPAGAPHSHPDQQRAGLVATPKL